MSTGKLFLLVFGICAVIGVIIIGSCAGLVFVGFKNADAASSPRIDAMFNAIDNKTFADTYETETSEELRDTVSKKEYEALGNAIALRLGKLKTKTMRRAYMSQHNADSFLDVTYDATFEKGNGTITAKLKKQGDDWKFISFHVRSPVFEQDIATKKCPSCNEPHAANAKFCPYCGQQLSEATSDQPIAETRSELYLSWNTCVVTSSSYRRHSRLL